VDSFDTSKRLKKTKVMRILLVFICSLTLALVNASAQGTPQTKEKKKAAPTGQAQPAKPAAGKPVQTGKPAGPPRKPAEVGKAKGTTQSTYAGKPAQTGKAKGTTQSTYAGKPTQTGKAKREATPATYGKPTEAGKAKAAGKAKPTAHPATAAGKPAGPPSPAAGGKAGKAGVAAGKPVKAQHFNLPKQPNTAKAPAVKFQQGKHIAGSQNWQGQQYAVFRNYKSQWHDQGWWHSHYNNIVFVFGAPYYWNAGYWFPAWGYYPNAYYAWDGPIYGYNHLPPDQVIANVQAALQEQGYYHGDVDGAIGPLTRAALADYQRDHGLYTTSTIDQPTLQSLGMA
jgi:hypothetical protein